MTLSIEEVVGLAPVIPVVVIDDVEDAVPLAEALVRGGLPAIEVTLRTTVAAAAIERIAAEVADAVVGAGTVTSARQVAVALEAGARFLVSPGATPVLLDALQLSGVPFLPGVATATDIVAVLERRLTVAKLFPAEVIGGVRALKAFAGPFPQMRFCPTGGIDASKAPEYLALENVVCVGGSWMVPKDAIAAGDWDRVAALAAEAAALSPAATGAGTARAR
jgi:2-dehydro-3-deoxyphosphogluconate aldolase / (4S)-4-hydroxy-2-oxoglutarate aldolase